MTNEDLNRENFHALCLQQALVGAISSNVRLICLQSLPDALRVSCVLERESESDREEFGDLVSEIEALLPHPFDVTVDVTVHEDPIDLGRTEGRPIYKRKED